MNNRSITLSNPGQILDTTLVVHYRPTEFEWDIRQIEVFADSACMNLLADDVQMSEFDAAQQKRIYTALSDAAHTTYLRNTLERQLGRPVSA